jgi:hypothetical protein
MQLPSNESYCTGANPLMWFQNVPFTVSPAAGRVGAVATMSALTLPITIIGARSLEFIDHIQLVYTYA